MKTTEIEISEESRELTHVSVVTLRSPRMGDVEDLDAGIILPDENSIKSVKVSDMLKVIEACLDGTVAIGVIRQMCVCDLQDLYGEALTFFLRSGKAKIKRSWKLPGEKASKSKEEASANESKIAAGA